MKTKRKSLIDKLDKEFSIYIRNRDAKGGIAECITCGVKKEVKQLQKDIAAGNILALYQD
jgi:hypothetical protein